MPISQHLYTIEMFIETQQSPMAFIRKVKH